MATYYVNDNAQNTGEHEVHLSTCTFLPSYRSFLGEHASCWGAIVEARKIYSNVDGCFWCSNACHTR